METNIALAYLVMVLSFCVMVLVSIPDVSRHGGLIFWRIGRFGGSFYIANRSR